MKKKLTIIQRIKACFSLLAGNSTFGNCLKGNGYCIYEKKGNCTYLGKCTERKSQDIKMDRTTYLEWCKNRALAYVKHNDIKNAFTSFKSDMSKHPETKQHIALELGTMLLLSGHLSTPQQMTDWINGFN